MTMFRTRLKRKTRISQDDWPQILEQYKKGQTLSSIARNYDCTPSAISYIVKRAENYLSDHNKLPASNQNKAPLNEEAAYAEFIEQNRVKTQELITEFEAISQDCVKNLKFWQVKPNLGIQRQMQIHVNELRKCLAKIEIITSSQNSSL